MPLHTPQSIWAKNKQPMLEVASDGIGVSLGENSYLLIRWSESLASEQVRKWLAFFVRAMNTSGSIEETLGITLDGKSSEVMSLEELRNGLALLTNLRIAEAKPQD